MGSGKVLIVDDEEYIREVLTEFLTSEGYDIFCAKNFEEVSKYSSVDIVILDVRLPDINGIDAIYKIKDMFKNCEIIMITAFEKDAQSAVSALNKGAFDYLTKPFKLQDLEFMIEKAMRKVALQKENERLRMSLKKSGRGFGELVGVSDEMQDVYEKIRKVSESDIAVLITGESGTGKELCARTIHKMSLRDGKFVAINCAAIPENLLESELFGYESGAFSGAKKTKKGLLEEANGGTIFLDEIGDMPIGLQSKMLRFLESSNVRRLGGNTLKKVDARVISATNKDLKTLVDSKKFRPDLFYRISTFSIELPPLRNRKEDIPVLAKHILKNISSERGVSYTLSSGALKALLLYDYPGNVREMKNILISAAVMSDGVIVYEDLPDYVKFGNEDTFSNLNLEDKISNYEKKLIEDAMRKSGGVKTKAAEMLGITFRSLRYKLDKYGIGK